MKRRIAAFLCAALLLAMTGCGEDPEKEIKSPYTYYYVASEIGYTGEDGVICGELRETAGHENSLDWILEDYLRGPVSESLISPVPKNTRLVSLQVQEKEAFLKMNEAFGSLSGVELSLAAGCIARTCFQMEEIEKVSISASSGLLDGKQSIALSREDIFLQDSSADLMNTQMNLYFGDQSGRYLIAEEITVSLANLDGPEDYLVRQLISGSRDRALKSTMPEGTRILETRVEDGLCNINFSRQFLENMPEDSIAQYLTLMSVVNTVLQRQETASVEIYVEGVLLTRYGVWNLNAPLVRDERMIGPVRTGLNEFDADLYLAVDGGNKLCMVPTRVHQTANETTAELLCKTLLTYESKNCLENPFPQGTTLLGVRQAGELCLVDLSKEFLTAEDMQAAVRAMAATLCAIDGIGSVRIVVDGGIPAEADQDLFATIIPQEDWVV